MRFELVVNIYVKTSLLTGTLSLHGDGTNWRPLIEVRDVARAHIACLEGSSDEVGGEIFNVLHDNFQIRHLAKDVQAALQERGREISIETVSPPARVRDYRCSAATIREPLGFEARVTVEESVVPILDAVADREPHDFLHPRDYNIEWMTILDGVSKQIANAGRMF